MGPEPHLDGGGADRRPVRTPQGRDAAAIDDMDAPIEGHDAGPDAEVDPRNEQIERLLQAMEELPSHPTVALRVLWLVDDPSSDVARLAKTVELDPLLAARLIRISNSAYYSLRTPVTNVPRAIAALGFATVRSLAASAACGLTDDDTAVEGEFWTHAAAVANAAQMVAPRYNVPASDAFALGLLHDLGEALLHQADPESWAQLGPRPTSERELELFGITHAEAGARVLEAWKFPTPFCDAIANHHHQLSPRETPLTQCLIAAELVANLAVGNLTIARSDAARLVLALDGIEGPELDRIISRVRHEAAALSAVLTTEADA